MFEELKELELLEIDGGCRWCPPLFSSDDKCRLSHLYHSQLLN